MALMIPLFGPVPGGMEMMVILLIAVLLFGANKIPKLARSTGEAMGEFKKGRQEVEDELREMQDGGSDSVNADSTGETMTETETGNSGSSGGSSGSSSSSGSSGSSSSSSSSSE